MKTQTYHQYRKCWIYVSMKKVTFQETHNISRNVIEMLSFRLYLSRAHQIDRQQRSRLTRNNALPKLVSDDIVFQKAMGELISDQKRCSVRSIPLNSIASLSQRIIAGTGLGQVGIFFNRFLSRSASFCYNMWCKLYCLLSFLPHY